MGLSIKNEETERLVRELAKRRGVGVTTAIRLAVSNELSKDTQSTKDPQQIQSVVREAQERWKKFPAISMKEIDDFLYDDNGLPH